MPHGIDAYFLELARHRRRTALCGGVVIVLAGLLQLWLMRPTVVAVLNDPRRFGYEGEEQYVRRIFLETEGPLQEGHGSQNVIAIEMHRGGAGGNHGGTPKKPGDSPVPQQGATGPGEDPNDLQSRLRALALQGPVIRSEDLVVEKLVRPEYPDDARDADIEGLVELVARVDTTGAVSEVHIIGGSHQPSLERSATTAVLQCVYRPYRVHENAEPVWAYFRISFTLY